MTHRVLFLHGLEGSPTGHKPTWLRAAGHQLVAPALDTRALIAALSSGGLPVSEAVWAGPLATASEALREVTPEVLVGSSFGGGLAVELVHRGLWRGPTVLLAPAAQKLFGRSALPVGHGRTAVLHGRRDDVVPPADSLALAAGSPGEVQLWLVDDDHRLNASVDAGLLGRLISAVLG